MRLAEEQQVSVPRLLIEAALASRGETPTERRHAMVALFGLRRSLAGMATNVNQLAAHANATRRVPARRRELCCRSCARPLDRIDEAIDRLGGDVIPNITRGARMRGVMLYLVGPGRRNEHSEPHLVAGDAAVMAWHDDAELSTRRGDRDRRDARPSAPRVRHARDDAATRPRRTPRR